ncbi:MAG TPA: transcription termination/antitermination NusG family protein [Candidatus Angelobacter sp.]|nr:transcription termination/antitermination NusG family protein [Candidatus Angelobacter sp.]
MLFNDSEWFALQVKARTEHQVASILRTKEYEEFLPTSNTKKRGGSSSSAPLFPGYVFCRMNPHAHGLVMTTPGVIRIVGFGGKPVPIDPEEIQSIQLIVKSGVPTCMLHGLHPGDKVCITEGPLQGAIGVLASIHAPRRFVVSLSMMMRTVAVEVKPEWITMLQPLPPRPAFRAEPSKVSAVGQQRY